MRNGRFFLCGLIVSGVVAGSSLPPVQVQDQPPAAPYLFYYSATQNAFTIERADGSDSRPFAAGEMTPDTNAVSGPGWSPSGKWFAWTSAHVESEVGASNEAPHALSVDGSRRVSALDAYDNAWLAWSPTEDMLLLTGNDRASTQDKATGQRTIRLFAALIDPAADRVIASQECQQPSDQPSSDAPDPRLSAQWTADGQYVIARLPAACSPGSQGTTFTIFDLQGHIAQKTISEPLVDHAPSPRQVLYYAGEALVTEDLISGATQTLAPTAPTDPGSALEWSPDDRSGVMAFIRCVASKTTCDPQLWLLHPEAHRFALIWPHLASQNGSDPFMPVWSPDSRRIVFLDSSGVFYAYDVNTQAITALTPPLPQPVNYTLGMWEWTWTDNDRIVLPGQYDREKWSQDFYIYDFSTGQRTRIETTSGLDWPLPRLSADGHYAAYVRGGTIIENLANGTQRTLAPHDKSYMSVDEGDVRWSRDQDWLIIFDNATIAGGGGSYWIIVANADGSQRRDLNRCWGSDLCAGWLPPQVDPADLTPGHTPPPAPAPAMTLNGSHWSWLLSWSPDGRRLFAGLSASEKESSSLWDAASGVEFMILRDMWWDSTIRWQADEPGNYLPVFLASDFPDCNHLLTSPDGSQVVTCQGIDDAHTGTHLLELSEGLDTFWGPPTVSYSPDGRLFAAPIPGKASAVYVWNTSTWQVVAKIDGFHTAAAFSPDGTRLAVAHSWTIDLWNVTDLLAQFRAGS